MSSSSRSGPLAEEGRRTRLARGRVVLVPAAVLALAVCGCGLGPEDHPVIVEQDVSTLGPPSGRPDVKVRTLDVFLIEGNRLVRVRRSVQAALGLHASLLALTQPISSAEADEGLRTAIPASTSTPAGTVIGTVARISMPDGFDRLPLHEQIGAMSQMVYTVTADTGAASIRLLVGDREVPVPDGRGQLLDRPVGRTDYLDWAPQA